MGFICLKNLTQSMSWRGSVCRVQWRPCFLHSTPTKETSQILILNKRRTESAISLIHTYLLGNISCKLNSWVLFPRKSNLWFVLIGISQVYNLLPRCISLGIKVSGARRGSWSKVKLVSLICISAVQNAKQLLQLSESQGHPSWKARIGSTD